MIIKLPSNDTTIPQVIAENTGCHVWVNGAETIIYTGEDISKVEVGE